MLYGYNSFAAVPYVTTKYTTVGSESCLTTNIPQSLEEKMPLAIGLLWQSWRREITQVKWEYFYDEQDCKGTKNSWNRAWMIGIPH